MVQLITVLFVFSILGCQNKTQSPPVDKDTVATLISVENNVKKRNAKELIWNDAEVNSPLKNHDAVKTGDSSRGVIRYSDLTSLNLEENTMVIVVDRTVNKNIEKSVVALPTGSLDSDLSTKTEKTLELVVKTQGGWIKASNRDAKGSPQKARFRASVNPSGKLEVKSTEGEIKLVVENREQVIKENQKVEIPTPPSNKDAEKMTAIEFKAPPSVSKKQWESVKTQVAPQTVDQKAEPKVSPKPASVVPKKASNHFKINSPTNRSTVKKSRVKVQGTMSSDLSAYLNGQPVSSKSGNFSISVKLNPGVNLLTFQIIGPKKGDVRYETIEIIRK